MLKQDVIVDEHLEGPEQLGEFRFGEEWGDLIFKVGKDEAVLGHKREMTFYFSLEVAS